MRSGKHTKIYYNADVTFTLLLRFNISKQKIRWCYQLIDGD